MAVLGPLIAASAYEVKPGQKAAFQGGDIENLTRLGPSLERAGTKGKLDKGLPVNLQVIENRDHPVTAAVMKAGFGPLPSLLAASKALAARLAAAMDDRSDPCLLVISVHLPSPNLRQVVCGPSRRMDDDGWGLVPACPGEQVGAGCSWARVNGGNLNVVVTAIGTDAGQHMTTTFRTTTSGSSVELAAPLLARSGRWARSVLFSHPRDTYPYACTYAITASQGGTGRIGQIATWNDENGDFSYGKTADTQAGISFTDGSSGSLHISNSQSDAFSEHYRGDTLNYVLSDFNSGTYSRNPPPSGQYNCDDPPGSVHPYQWAGGIQEGATISGSNLEDACPTAIGTTSIDEGKNAVFNSASATAGGWSVGLSAFGVGVSMDSGYSDNVAFDINTLAASDHHWMCGRSEPPVDAPDVWTGPNT